MRILVIGAGVIGSVYAARLIHAGDDVTMLARGSRLAALRAHGIQLLDERDGQAASTPVRAIGSFPADDSFDLVLVAVRADQVLSTIPDLLSLRSKPDIVFFGNLAEHRAALSAALETQSFFGFPGVGGSLVSDVVHYVLIDQQQTTLGEVAGDTSARVIQFRQCLEAAGFRTTVSGCIDDWLSAHAAFIVPVMLALDASGGDPSLLSNDRGLIGLLVDSTRQLYRALRKSGNTEIPRNLRTLYSRPMRRFAIVYWRRVMRDGRGELWFGAHGRAAPEETASMTKHLDEEMKRDGHVAAALSRLEEVSRPVESPRNR